MARATDLLLGALQAMVFYDQRFAKPIAGSVPGFTPEVAPQVYVDQLVMKLPQEIAEKAASLTVKALIDSREHCPSPVDVRTALAEGALRALDSNFLDLYERAKRFIAFPPKTQRDAASWLNKVIYTTVRRLTRERFMVVDPADWAKAVTETVFDTKALAEYSPESAEVAPRQHHDFMKLIGKEHGGASK